MSALSASVPSAEPYAWPYDGSISRATTALIIIDMQVDFCGEGGYVDTMGYDITMTRRPIEPLSRLLAACRTAGVRVIHTREGHRPTLTDLPENKRVRSKQIGAEIGAPGPCGRVLTRGEPGWQIIPELFPLPNEDIIDKPGKGCFLGTDLLHLLRTAGVTHIFFGGITTDVCVHTTMREANDHGFECLLLSDGTAATDQGNHNAALHMVKMQGGVFGAVATCDAAAAAVRALGPAPSTLKKAAKAVDGGSPMGRPVPKGTLTLPSARPSPFVAPCAKLALVMIDFQKDFLSPTGFAASLGNDVTRLQSCIPPAEKLLAAARAAKVLVVHTLECHAPDLSDCPPSKKARCASIGEVRDAAPDDGRVLVRGEPGNELIEALAPLPGEMVVHKPGKGAFWDTGLHERLTAAGVTHLLFAGVTADVCVQTSMREANDRGYTCLLVSDATESYFPGFRDIVVDMCTAQGAIVGWAAPSADVCARLEAAKAKGFAAVLPKGEDATSCRQQ